MNQELQLKLQAGQDGELSEMEGRQLLESVAGDRDAQALLAELAMTRGFLAGNEPEARVPETREFYWSKIERAIERAEREEEAAPAARPSLLAAWRRMLAPLAGVALVVFLSIAGLNHYDYDLGSILQKDHLSAVENHSEHTSSFSFRSHAENMTVVWVYDKTQDDSGEDDDDADDLFLQ